MQHTMRIERVAAEAALGEALLILHDHSCSNYNVFTGIMQERSRGVHNTRQVFGVLVVADCPDDHAAILPEAIQATVGESGGFCRIAKSNSLAQ